MASFDEELPKKTSELIIGEELAALSIDELVARVAVLKAEIERIEETVTAKRESLGVADSFFKR